MSVGRIGTAASLLLLFSLPTNITVSASSGSPDEDGLAAAYGTIVDSVTISGNERTRGFAILREMQVQPGDVLEQDEIQRDIRFISDLSPIAEVYMTVDSLSPGHTAVRVRVVERSGWFLRSVLPMVKYNFETGLTYGLRWKDKNFQGRLEHVTLSYTRNQRNDELLTLSWSSPWIGWRHIGIGGQVRYFNRGKPPSEIAVLEDTGGSVSIALPLTQSRMRFAQVQASLSLDKSRSGVDGEPFTDAVIVSPQLGYRFDSRDSHVKPAGGGSFSVSLAQSIQIDNGTNPNYRFRNEMRWFAGLSERNVLAFLSNLFYQFGDFADYAQVGLGGARSLRGYPESRFTGFHRWFGTIELRHLYLPRKVFYMPVVKQVDIALAFVTFIDTGIAWNDASDFNVNQLHGTGGCGFRFYSPLRDVLRLDFGFSLSGDARFNAGTGIRF